MLLARSLRACLLALLITQVVASNYPRQTDDEETTTSARTTSAVTSTTATTSSTTPTTSSTPATSSSTATSETDKDTEPSTTADDDQDTTTTTPTTTPTNTPADSTDSPPEDEGPVTVTEGEVTYTSARSRTATRSSSSASASATQEEKKDEEDPPIGTGPIVGMSVAGGLAIIGIIAFFVWKFTRKRSSFDDSEPIKWPELNNSHTQDSHPLPTHSTGRAGLETNSDLSRIDSTNYSTTDFGSHQDPYAVPPLPHLNPNQPYRDDPTAAAAYYDPYRGPVPATVENGQNWEGEAIPMNQIHGQQQQQPYAGRQSPGPYQAYDQGRASPAPPNMGAAYQNAGGQTAYGAGGSQQGHAAYNQPYNQGPHGQGPPGY